MVKLTVNFNGQSEVFEVEKGERLIDCLKKYSIDAPCGGRGICGKCVVKVIKGNLELEPAEKKFIRNENERLACFMKLFEDTEIEIGSFSNLIETRISTDVTPDNNIEYGIAIDIGTTTIAAYLVDCKSAKILKVHTEMNSQRTYGADVISRINYTIEKENGLKLLNELITSQIYKIIDILRQDIKIDKIVLVGNTTMVHLFLGLDCKSLGVYPFKPILLDRKTVSYDGIEIEIFPGISAYVGGDVVSGVLSCKMYESEDLSLFIDIGTNGEIVLGDKNGLSCCGTAAGPAFEGAKIKYGVGSVEGAINRVRKNPDDNSISFETINNKKPVGICGSGIIDAVYVLKELGIIDETGRFEDNSLEIDGEPVFKITEDIFITQKDIREIQLAKAAIAAGISILLKKNNKTVNDLKNIYIAGGFGSYLNKESAAGIGLLPCSDKIKILGNAAGSGAVIALLSNEKNKLADKIKDLSEYVELSIDTDFQDEFVDNMYFES